ncbi:MAG: hypothetical protein OXT68_15415 [Chloroflexota bacterium]|nr:hypothetical protein [Chloroflexota bacterium]MDE2952139.1 hypothetical protein [Chloroflexota bacterium]
MIAKPHLKKSVRLHREASQLANKARIARFDGDEITYLKLTQQAFQKESESARLLREDPSHHMFAILHRSAATLAYRCGEHQTAEELILEGMRQIRNEGMREDLYNLLDKVRLAVKYGQNVDQLENDELVMTLQGIEANRGLIDPSMLSKRILNFSTLVRNTIGNINRYKFRNRRKVDQDYRVLATVPSFGSYRIGMTVTHVGPNRFPGISYFDGVRLKVIENLRLVNAGGISRLQSDLNDDRYLQNLFGLAKELAPDGDTITAVGIEAEIEGQFQSILLDSTRDNLNEMVLPLDEESVADEYRITEERDTVVGVLQYADATKNQVKLFDDDGKWWQIVVPEGLAEDVVKPYFGDRVQVEGRHIIKNRKAKRLFLHDIRAAGENSRPHMQPVVSLLEA